VVQPLEVVNQPVTPFPTSDPLPIIAPIPINIINVHPVSVVSSATIPPTPTTVSNLPIEQKNIIGPISQPINSAVQNPVVTLSATSSQVSQMATSTSTLAAATSAQVASVQHTEQRILELEHT
jgi:hypothetical protein